MSPPRYFLDNRNEGSWSCTESLSFEALRFVELVWVDFFGLNLRGEVMTTSTLERFLGVE